MKRVCVVVYILMILIVLNSCGNNSNISYDEVSKTIDRDNNHNNNNDNNDEAKPSKDYIGDYESQSLYKKILEIESCVDPEQLCVILEGVYNKSFYYMKFEWDNAKNGYFEPYNDFICNALCMHNTYRMKAPISSDTYVFFEKDIPSEIPSFIMDNEGTYLVSEYEIKNFDDGTHGHLIQAWVCTDLYMCHYGYIDEEPDDLATLKEAVETMESYVEFENLLSKTTYFN